MGISFRFYAFFDNGSLRRIPKRIANDLGITDEVVPELAGARQRIAQVILEIDDGRPARIIDARGFFGYSTPKVGSILDGLTEHVLRGLVF